MSEEEGVFERYCLGGRSKGQKCLRGAVLRGDISRDEACLRGAVGGDV